MNAQIKASSFAPAVRAETPLMIGLIGPSGTGKTLSALRLARGLQLVTGGETFFIDTEAKRALHYAGDSTKYNFQFKHSSLMPPFSSQRYLDIIWEAYEAGAKTIIIDSMSHEHEGPGGLLEQHEEEVTRMAGDDYAKRERVKVGAWNIPKSNRRRLINTMIQIPVNFIVCFRAKEKLKVVTGKPPENQGFMPIAGEEFVYEMTAKCLLLPGANGVPSWSSEWSGEKQMMKLPEQFKDMFTDPRQIDEELGRQLALWSAGAEVDALLRKYATPTITQNALAEIERLREKYWKAYRAEEKKALVAASDKAKGVAPIVQTGPATSAASTAAASTTTATAQPAPDAATAIAQLRSCPDRTSLAAVWSALVAIYNTAGITEVPLDVEAVYQEQKETL